MLTDAASGVVDATRDLFARESPGVLTFDVVGALWAMSRGLAAVIRALHEAYDVEERRSYVWVRLTGLGLALGTVLAGAVLLGMFVLGPLFGRGHDVAEAIGAGGGFAFLWNVARPPLVFTVLVAWPLVVLHVAPAHDGSWRHDVPGAVLAAVLWIVVSARLRLYLEIAAGANELLGVLGGALIVLIWLYLLSLGLLLGAELNGVRASRSAGSAGGDDKERKVKLDRALFAGWDQRVATTGGGHRLDGLPEPFRLSVPHRPSGGVANIRAQATGLSFGTSLLPFAVFSESSTDPASHPGGQEHRRAASADHLVVRQRFRPEA